MLASVAFVALTVPASARPHHHRAAHAVAAMPAQTAGADQDSRYPAATQQAAGEATQSQSRRPAAVQAQANSAFGGFTSNSLISEAR